MSCQAPTRGERRPEVRCVYWEESGVVTLLGLVLNLTCVINPPDL